MDGGCSGLDQTDGVRVKIGREREQLATIMSVYIPL